MKVMDEVPAGATGHTEGTGRSMIDLEFVRGLIEAVDESGIDSLEITRAGTRIRIAKTPPPAPVNAAPITTVPAAQLVSPGAAPIAPAPADPAAANTEPAEDAEDASRLEVTSPMVGTFYRAPAPEAPPYVEVGSQVAKGQTLCILEAMKLMNELESEFDGVVRGILVENGEPVEYGQALFLIDPA